MSSIVLYIFFAILILVLIFLCVWNTIEVVKSVKKYKKMKQAKKNNNASTIEETKSRKE